MTDADAMVLTISDGVTAGTRADESGVRLEERLSALGFRVTRAVTADEPDDIASVVRRAADEGARLIVTTGGTGLGPRDRTPEAVTTIVDYVIPGFGEAMRAVGRESTPMASLSRSFGAVRGRTLILCLPGSPRGALESLGAVEPLLEHSLEMVAGRTAHGA
jgi:molybdenum cofactor synthesis domain-containing protein